MRLFRNNIFFSYKNYFVFCEVPFVSPSIIDRVILIFFHFRTIRLRILSWHESRNGTLFQPYVFCEYKTVLRAVISFMAVLVQINSTCLHSKPRAAHAIGIIFSSARCNQEMHLIPTEEHPAKAGGSSRSRALLLLLFLCRFPSSWPLPPCLSSAYGRFCARALM